MAYDGNDRFRNWGPDEYESKILKLEATIKFLESRVITIREHHNAIAIRLRERLAHNNLTS